MAELEEVSGVYGGVKVDENTQSGDIGCGVKAQVGSNVYGGCATGVTGFGENEQAGVISFGDSNVGNGAIGVENAISIETGTKVGENLPAKRSFWDKVKSVLFYEIKIELTPYEQKIEDEVNEFLHQEITWKKVKDFLFKEITFGKKTNL